QAAVQFARLLHYAAARARDRDRDDAPAAVPERDGVRLADAREGAREVGVVAQRHDAIQRADRERGVAARVVELFRVLGAGRGHRVYRFANAERPDLQHAEPTGVDLAGETNAGAIACNHVVAAGRRARAVPAVAEHDGRSA